MRENAMPNDTEITETTEIVVTEIRATSTYTALGYVFVLAMGGMAVWVTPSQDTLSAQKFEAIAVTSFVPIGGVAKTIVLGQAAKAHSPEEADHSSQLSSLDRSNLNNPDPNALCDLLCQGSPDPN
jgi:hypothetical protein